MQGGFINNSQPKVRYHESSPLRDLRDGDSTGKQWKRNRSDAVQNFSNMQELSQIKRVVEMLRRRILGGSAPTKSGNFNFRGLYVPGTSYDLYDGVSLGSGTSTGVYWSLMASNTNAPDSGLGWMQIATMQGQWQ